MQDLNNGLEFSRESIIPGRRNGPRIKALWWDKYSVLEKLEKKSEEGYYITGLVGFLLNYPLLDYLIVNYNLIFLLYQFDNSTINST